MKAMINTNRIAICRKVYLKDRKVSLGTLIPDVDREVMQPPSLTKYFKLMSMIVFDYRNFSAAAIFPVFGFHGTLFCG